jgi:hypothetical protein
MDYNKIIYQLRLEQIQCIELGLPLSISDDDIIYMSNLIHSYNFVGRTDSQKIIIRNELNRLSQGTSYYTSFTQGLEWNESISYDADSDAFFARVIAAGGTLTPAEQIATNQLVLDMKSTGIWTSMKAVYPMVGGSAAACSQNLKSSSFTGTFTSGWTFASTGVTPNGTSAYMDTNLIPNTSLLLNSTHISFYNRSNNTPTTLYTCSMGCYISGSNNIALIIKRNIDNIKYVAIYDDSFNASTSSTGNIQGFYVGNKQSQTNLKLLKNNTLISSNTNNNTSTNLPPNSIYIGNLNGIASSAVADNKECAFASIGDGLTDTQASNFYTAVQAFQTSLSRQV